VPHQNPSRAKTQTLSLRLDPKTRFVLELMSRFRGQTITVAVERAIHKAAEEVIEFRYDIQGQEISRMRWVDFWDPEEGIRALRLLAHRPFPSTYEEDEIRRFTLDHRVFFTLTGTAKSLIEAMSRCFGRVSANT
jgi:uncharacterized protein (DUF1778 family)